MNNLPETEAPPTNGEEIAEDILELIHSIKRNLRGLVVATVFLYLIAIGIAIFVYVQAVNNKEALCNVRQELEDRVESQRQFLIAHPHGISGIEPAVIKQGIANTQGTVDALDSLHCP